MSVQPNSSVPRSRKRRFARWLVYTLVSGFIVTASWNLGEREWIRVEGNRELAAARAEADADDPDWSWEKLSAARKRPPAGAKNGAELIPQIKKLTHAEWGKELTNEQWKSRLDAPPNERYSPQLLAQVRREAGASAEAIALARTLKDRSFGHRDIAITPNVLDTLLRDTQDTRHAADLLRWDAVLAAEDGDVRRAADDLLALLNASRSIGDEPLLISQLVRMAVRTVAVRAAERLLAQTADAPDLASFQTALEADAEEPLLLYGVRGDRAAFDRLFENLASGVATPERSVNMNFDTLWGKFAWWHYRVRLLKDRAFFLHWMTAAARAARLPLEQQSAAVATLPGPPEDEKMVMARLMLPAVNKVADAQLRTAAEARCAVAGIACEQFRRKHNRWPNDLTELVPAFLAAVPLDPYSGEPLRLAKSNDGCAVYSVGKDRRGEERAFDPREPTTNVSPRFRLWNPDQRRQPAPPEPAPDP